MVYMYIVKHNYILGSMFTNTKAQLHVSAIFRLYTLLTILITHYTSSHTITSTYKFSIKCKLNASICHFPSNYHQSLLVLEPG